MIALLLSALLALPAPPLIPTLAVNVPAPAPGVAGTALPAAGLATYYGDGIFPGVVANRVRWGQIAADECPACVGYVAMLWPADIGRRVCVDMGRGVRGPYLVVDVAADVDRPGLLARGWVLDVQYRVWFGDWGFPRRPMPVTVQECAP